MIELVDPHPLRVGRQIGVEHRDRHGGGDRGLVVHQPALDKLGLRPDATGPSDLAPCAIAFIDRKKTVVETVLHGPSMQDAGLVEQVATTQRRQPVQQP